MEENYSFFLLFSHLPSFKGVRIMKYHGLVISDLHVGAFPIEKLYQEFKYSFLEKIKEMKQLDFIIFCGDVFDHRLFLNERESYYVYRMMEEMLNLCKDDIKIRFVYGTESHENNQYGFFSNLKGDIRIIKTVETEELFPDCKVLYLPEEYITDQKSYYEKYFIEDAYAMVFGHGIIKEFVEIMAVQIENIGTKRKHVPAFTCKELEKICKGSTFFGHYHVHREKERVCYIGSFSRWQFGEEEPKGFYEVTYDTKKETCKKTFIENTLADSYTTISYDAGNPIFKNIDHIETAVAHAKKVIESEGIDHVRFQFQIPSSVENPEFLSRMIQDEFKFNDQVRINFSNNQKQKKPKEKEEKEKHTYDFIFDKNIKFENKTAHFIEIEYNKTIPVKRVASYLYDPLQEIIEKEE